MSEFYEINDVVALGNAINAYLAKLNLMHASAADDLYQLTPQGFVFKLCAEYNKSPVDVLNSLNRSQDIKDIRARIARNLITNYGWNQKRIGTFLNMNAVEVSRALRGY